MMGKKQARIEELERKLQDALNGLDGWKQSYEIGCDRRGELYLKNIELSEQIGKLTTELKDEKAKPKNYEAQSEILRAQRDTFATKIAELEAQLAKSQLAKSQLAKSQLRDSGTTTNHRKEAEGALRNLNRAESSQDIIACALTSIAHSFLSQEGINNDHI